MLNWLQALDGVLRGEATRPARLRDGQVPVSLGGLAVLGVLLGAAYGFCKMAWVLRPFVGSPDMPVQFFRAESWGNAYVILGRRVWEGLTR